MASAYAAIALGTLSGGWRIIHTMGSKITKLQPVGGFAAETAGAISLFTATHLGVPVSTHYARRSRKPSPRELADRQLLVEIEAARSGRRRVYGARKTWKELRRRDVEAGRDQVARVMREHGLVGKLRGSKKRTTIPDEAAAERARDLLQRDFTATAPNEKWVADLTYIRTWNGFVYLAFILDCYSRMIVGWQLASHMRAELVLDALEMANGLRRPEAGLIAHSDRGSQYAAERYREILGAHGFVGSMGWRGFLTVPRWTA